MKPPTIEATKQGATMAKYKEVFSSFSVNDQAKAKVFYGETLGLEVEDGKMGLILHLVPGGTVYIYPKENHQPATYTVLNLEVDNIDAAVAELAKNGVKMQIYEGMGQDDQGISRGKVAGRGPDIAWFADPAGNIVSVLQR